MLAAVDQVGQLAHLLAEAAQGFPVLVAMRQVEQAGLQGRIMEERVGLMDRQLTEHQYRVEETAGLAALLLQHL